MTHAHEATSPGLGDEIKPHRIHVSSKYLELTRQKLELTRLPHRIPEPRSDIWWEPQTIVEPLVDFWLERFSWRDQEQELNSNAPQFRTAFYLTAIEAPIRLHFIHARSPNGGAVPLLLIPPFPFTNLSLTHLIDVFTKPGDGAEKRCFHLVIPTLPGLGFSDALPGRMPLVAPAAHMLNVLMERLGYGHYLVTNSGPSNNVLAPLDCMVADQIASSYPESCLGIHLLSPPLRPPRFRESPVGWAKWKAVSRLRVPMLGYSREDVAALKRAGGPTRNPMAPTPQAPLGFGTQGAYEPNTMAYALCDSPVGLLLFFLMVLRMADPNKGLSPSEIIKMTALTWLPGPEGTMRLWAQSASVKNKATGKPRQRPKAGFTFFEHGGPADKAIIVSLPRPTSNPYACSAWASQQYQIMASHRIEGRPGLIAWERPEVILNGVRELAKVIIATDDRLAPHGASESRSPNQAMAGDARSTGHRTAASIQPKASGGAGEIRRETDAQHRESAEQPILDASRQEAWNTPAESLSTHGQADSQARRIKNDERSDSDEFSEEESPNTVIAVPIGT